MTSKGKAAVVLGCLCALGMGAGANEQGLTGHESAQSERVPSQLLGGGETGVDRELHDEIVKAAVARVFGDGQMSEAQEEFVIEVDSFGETHLVGASAGLDAGFSIDDKPAAKQPRILSSIVGSATGSGERAPTTVSALFPKHYYFNQSVDLAAI